MRKRMFLTQATHMGGKSRQSSLLLFRFGQTQAQPSLRGFSMQTTTFSQRGKMSTQRLVIKTGMMILLLSALMVTISSWPAAAHAQPLSMTRSQQSTVYTQSQDIGTPRIDLFARGTDNTLLHRWGRYAFSLGPWESLGYRLATAPSVVRD